MNTIGNSFLNLNYKNKNDDGKGKNKNPSFGFVNNVVVNMLGSQGLSRTFNYVNAHPAVEVATLDLTTMVAPRTAIDYNQNPSYGKETFFRELAPVIFNPFGPGIIAYLMMKNKDYKGTANSSVIRDLHSAWANSAKGFNPENASPDSIRQAVKRFGNYLFENTDAIVGKKYKIGLIHFKNIANESKEELLDKFADLTLGGYDKKAKAKLLDSTADLYTMHTGAASSLIVKTGKTFDTSINKLLDDASTLAGSVFTKTPPEKLLSKVDNLVKFNMKKTALGVIVSLAGIVTLPLINNKMTEKRTGQNGYCAYKDFGKDCGCEKPPEDKKHLKILKTLSAAGMFLLMVGTMGGFGKKGGFFQKGGFQNFRDKIELRDKTAHMDLIKLIYGTSLISRIAFTRDEQELKVTTVRDYAGFLNWLVLGGFVAKGVAHLADRKNAAYVNISGSLKEGGIFKTVGNWLGNVSKKSYGEMLSMTKNMPSGVRTKMLAVHNASTIAGLAYSMIALGIAMPLINNRMTDKAREKQIAALKTKNSAPSAISVKNYEITEKESIYSPEAFNNALSYNLFGDFIKNINNLKPVA